MNPGQFGGIVLSGVGFMILAECLTWMDIECSSRSDLWFRLDDGRLGPVLSLGWTRSSSTYCE
jgi:hypothetical protein